MNLLLRAGDPQHLPHRTGGAFSSPRGFGFHDSRAVRLNDAVVYLDSLAFHNTCLWYCWAQALHNLVRRPFDVLRILFVAMLIIIANNVSILLSRPPGANYDPGVLRTFLG